MRVSKDSVIAIFGASATGKSTIAKLIANSLGFSIRCCGEIVKEAIKNGGSGINELPDQEHLAIDAATQAWVLQGGPSIVEGRYLDQVLSPLSNKCVLIRLDADATVRAERLVLSRPGYTPTVADSRDLEFRARLYKNVEPLPPAFSLDTSNDPADACAKLLIAKINQMKLALG